MRWLTDSLFPWFSWVQANTLRYLINFHVWLWSFRFIIVSLDNTFLQHLYARWPTFQLLKSHSSEHKNGGGVTTALWLLVEYVCYNNYVSFSMNGEYLGQSRRMLGRWRFLLLLMRQISFTITHPLELNLQERGRGYGIPR
jgi:hypothetical protein